MAKKVEIGSVVAIIKKTPCCANGNILGAVYTVARLGRYYATCQSCGTSYEGIFAASENTPLDEAGYDVSRLMVLDGDAEQECAEKVEVA
jgi:hypothetical protein